MLFLLRRLKCACFFSKGASTLCIVDLRTGERSIPDLSLPPVGSLAFGPNADYDAPHVRLLFSSPVHAARTLDVDLEIGTVHDRGRASQLDPGIAAVLEEQGRLHTVTLPGQLSLSIAGTEPVPSSGSAKQPALLVSYGCYGEPISLDYRFSFVPLMLRGWSIVFAHVAEGPARGLVHTQRIDQLLNAAQYLSGVSGGRVAAMSHSAGAALLGAAINSAPSAFRAAVMISPFVDLIGGLGDPSLPLAATDVTEWGDILNDTVARENVRSISPVENIHRSAAYPGTF